MVQLQTDVMVRFMQSLAKAFPKALAVFDTSMKKLTPYHFTLRVLTDRHSRRKHDTLEYSQSFSRDQEPSSINPTYFSSNSMYY